MSPSSNNSCAPVRLCRQGAVHKWMSWETLFAEIQQVRDVDLIILFYCVWPLEGAVAYINTGHVISLADERSTLHVNTRQWGCAYTSVFNSWTVSFMLVWPVSSYPNLSVYSTTICFNLLLLTVIFPFKWNGCTTTGLSVTWKWKILLVMAVGLHIRGQTVLLTFPIGVCFIALAFRGKAIQISLAHSWTGKKKKKMDRLIPMAMMHINWRL